MKNFNEICKIVEGMDPLDYSAIVMDKTVNILPALRKYSGSDLDAVSIFASFLIASVYADGKLDEAEYLLMMPALKACFGEDFDYEAAKTVANAFKPEGRELKKAVDFLVDLIGQFDEQLKDDIVTLSLLICALDGKITLKEKRYVKQLIR